jgi:hypothetical protein
LPTPQRHGLSDFVKNIVLGPPFPPQKYRERFYPPTQKATHLQTGDECEDGTL